MRVEGSARDHGLTRPCRLGPGPAQPGWDSSSVLGSDPYIHVDGYDAGWIQLVCRSAGWFPKPWAEWRDPQGQKLLSLEEANALDEAGLFRTAVSSRIRDSVLGNVSCTVRNTALGQEKTTAMVIAGNSQVGKWPRCTRQTWRKLDKGFSNFSSSKNKACVW